MSDVIRGFFPVQIGLLERYAFEMCDQLSDDRRGLLGEAIERLRQVEYCLAQALAAVEYHHSIWRSQIDDRNTEHADALSQRSVLADRSRALRHSSFVAKLHTEAFYYFASRFQKILRQRGWPHLQFREIPGIRKVRNDLIEHPEGKNSRVFSGGTEMAAGQFNVWLKVPNSMEQRREPLDPGLVDNATALRDELDRILRPALAEILGSATG
jgi:hypothetical protein